MHIFNWHTLFYLSLHLAGGFFCLASILGIPGNLEESNPLVKKITRFIDVLLLLAWKGIPILLGGSLLAFYFGSMLLGKILSILSLGLGLALFCCLLALYKVK